MTGQSSLAEHSDVLMYLLLGLITFVGVLLKKWDMAHTKALGAVVEDMRTLSNQLNALQKDFYELRGEHNAHHGGNKYDDRGFRVHQHKED